MDMPALVGQYLELEKAGRVYKALCPFHHDEKTKSFTVYPDGAYCFGCGQYFSPVWFLIKFLGISKREALEILGRPLPTLPEFPKPPKGPIKPIPLDIIRNWHSMLKGRREYFHSRLFTDETIDRELWGWDGRRYVVTVWDGPPGRKCVCVRRRAAQGVEPKYLGLEGHNPRVLYNLWAAQKFYEAGFSRKVLYVFFGEFDAALAYQDGFPAISPTNGQNSWVDEWDIKLADYELIIVPDKGEELRGFQLASRFPCRAGVVRWPEGDFSDYNSFRMRGGTPEDFMSIVGTIVTPNYLVECFWEEQ